MRAKTTWSGCARPAGGISSARPRVNAEMGARDRRRADWQVVRDVSKPNSVSGPTGRELRPDPLVERREKSGRA